MSERTPVGQFVYDRATMPDHLREPGDPVRQSQTPPCCKEHTPGWLCLRDEGHDAATPTQTPTAPEGAGRSTA